MAAARRKRYSSKNFHRQADEPWGNLHATVPGRINALDAARLRGANCARRTKYMPRNYFIESRYRRRAFISPNVAESRISS